MEIMEKSELFCQTPQRVQAENVAIRAESGDNALSNLTRYGNRPETFPRMYIGKMNFDDRDIDSGNGVAKRDAVVRQSAGIEHNTGGFPTGPVDGFHNIALPLACRSSRVAR